MYEVKAAFLYHFASLVEWPEEALPTPDAPLRLCVVGDDSLGPVLERTVHGKSIAGHPLRVIFGPGSRQARTCHILFIGSSESDRTRYVMEDLRGISVLTVGDSEGFARRGGMVNFLLEDDRVRFEVNLEATQQARLKMGSRLLLAAKTVIRNQGSKQP